MPETIITFTVEKAGKRLDKLVLAHLPPEFSRSQVQTLIKDGHVTVDGDSLKAGHKLRGGETVQVTLPVPEESNIQPEEIALNIVHEEDVLMVIDKPAGLVVHPGAGHESGTLVNALLFRYPDMIDMEDDPAAEGRMGIVHRLDKDTSGLMVAARNTRTMHMLMAQFQERTVDKVYLALLEKTPDTLTGLIDAPIGRDPKQRKKLSVVHDGKSASTEFEVLDDNFRDGQALVRLILHTGRTHQIRVHMAFIGCPIVGDRVYGYRRQRVGLKRQFLHAAELGFDHPETGERLHFTSELPVSLTDLMKKLR